MDNERFSLSFHDHFVNRAAKGQPVMTLEGTLLKIGIVFFITIAGGALGFLFSIGPLFLLSYILSVVVALFTFLIPKISPLTAPLFGLMQGYAIGALSGFIMMSAAHHSVIVPIALIATVGILLSMFGLYALRWLEAWEFLEQVLIGMGSALILTFGIS